MFVKTLIYARKIYGIAENLNEACELAVRWVKLLYRGKGIR
ncbi:hypothetical protein RV07_GL001162 [Enterococcus malodoratus]|nr:hypothetical protein RV07_GL001162 [Enterococcus malodoratus]